MNSIKEKVPYPSDWKVKKLGELGAFLKGKGISKSETIESGLPCIRYGEIYTRHHDYIKEFYSFVDEDTANKSTEIMKGDILFAGSGETAEEIGKSVAYLHEEKAYAGGDIIILRTKDVDSKYLAFALNEGRLAKERAKLGQGHSVVHIYPKELKELIIHLPSEIEQQKIASILSTWDKAIELKEKLIEQKKEKKKGLMQKLLTGEVRLPGFSDEWEKVRIRDFCQTYSGGTPNRSIREYYEEGTIPWIKSGELNARKVTKVDEYITELGLENSSAKLVSPNTLLLALYGATAGVIAKCEITATINQAILAIIPNEKCDNNFLLYYLEYVMSEVINTYTQGGQPNLNAEIVKNLFVKLPSVEEQNRISLIFMVCDEDIELYTKELEQLKQQKQGLMQQLLTGKIRVKV